MAADPKAISFKRPWFGLPGILTWNLALRLYELPMFGGRPWWWKLRYHLWREFRDIRPNDMAREVQGPSPESLAFGETPLSALMRILKAAPIPAGARIVDVGCGRGNLVLGGACLGYRTLGLDYFPEYVERTRRVVDRLGCEGAELRAGDFLDQPLPPGDLYFLAATAFGERTRQCLLALLEDVPEGAYVVALDWVLESPMFELTHQFFIPASWGVAAACIHRRIYSGG